MFLAVPFIGVVAATWRILLQVFGPPTTGVAAGEGAPADEPAGRPAGPGEGGASPGPPGTIVGPEPAGA
jgi:hypothetical protein